jgi:hypothetical protein
MRKFYVTFFIPLTISIYLAGPISPFIHMLSKVDLFYLIAPVTLTFFLIIEKICTIILDREIHQVVKRMLVSTNRVVLVQNHRT